MIEINGEKSARVVPKSFVTGIGQALSLSSPAFGEFVFAKIGFKFRQQVQHMRRVEIEDALGARFARRGIAIGKAIGPIGVGPALRPDEQPILARAL